jgi:hypothetical protein
MRNILLIIALFLGLNVTAQNSRYYPVIMMMGQSSCDADAQRFIDSAGITDATQKNAICNLVIGLKSQSLWNKYDAIYPLVGGTATTHKYNLKDPQNTNSAFRIVWSGGVTHDANGVTGNGTTGYGNTFYTPSASGSLNSFSLGFYSKTNTAASSFTDIGAEGGGHYSLIEIYGSAYYPLINTSTVSSFAIATSLGYFSSSRTASNLTTTYQNGSSISTTATASTGLATNPIYLMSFLGASAFSTRNYCMFTIAEGLDATEQANSYTLFNAFQTALGR